MTGASRRTLNRLHEKGTIPRMHRDGQYHYSRTACEAWANGETDDEDGDDASPYRLITQCHRTIAQLLAPAEMFSRMVVEQNAAMGKRIADLERGHEELIKAREELLDASAERALLLKAQENSDKRKAWGMQQLARVLPFIGGKDDSAMKLLASFDPDQLQLLLETDLINDEQKTLLRQCLESTPALGAETKSETPANGAAQA